MSTMLEVKGNSKKIILRIFVSNVMIMDLLGRDLEYYLHKCGGKFSLKTVCMIAI